MRVTPALQSILSDAAKQDGRTVSDEIARRLEASFDDDLLPDRFGGRTTWALLELIAAALSQLREDTGECWHRDPFSFDHALKAVAEVLGYFRPPGEPDIPEDHAVLQEMRAQFEVDNVPAKQRASAERKLRAQLRTYPFGVMAARMAVFRVEVATPQADTAVADIFQRIKREVGMQLAASGRSPQADLIGRRKK